jgi:ferredoxin
MTYVVTESCIQCKYTDCVAVCPVDCFKQGPNFLVIDPNECIDCAVCVTECPVDAIFSEADVPADQTRFIELNAELSRTWTTITTQQPPLADADTWAKEKHKLHLLKRD